MSSTVYTKLDKGASCWIFIMAGKHKGLWKGEVLSCETKLGQKGFDVKAKIVDEAILDHNDHLVRIYYNLEPCCTYDAYPDTNDYRLLLHSYGLALDRVAHLENVVCSQRVRQMEAAKPLSCQKNRV